MNGKCMIDQGEQMQDWPRKINLESIDQEAQL